MDVAFVAYDGMTALDLVGVYDAVTRVDTMGIGDLEYDLVAQTPGAEATGRLQFPAHRVAPDLGEYDAVVVPGGVETRDLVEDDATVEWIRGAGDCEWIASVCTGSLLLGAADLLEGREATTHPTAYDALGEYCDVTDDRVVRDGHVVTARGVSSSIDLGLTLVELWAGETARERIRDRMDYPYGDW